MEKALTITFTIIIIIGLLFGVAYGVVRGLHWLSTQSPAIPIFVSPYPRITIPDNPNYDCDDATLTMVEWAESKGYSYKIIAGSPEVIDETFDQFSHVWILIEMQGKWIAYDWGDPYSDKQHYEGYIISKAELLKAVEAD